MKANVAVVIPYYHSRLSELETVSWRQALKVFKNRKMILIVPDNMKEEEYPKEAGLIYEVVPSAWLKSVSTYNRMMLDKNFYEKFLIYEYILIYQLDAFAFRDELECFCSYGYDYIGAPWLGGARYYKDFEKCVWYVGNGGLSLRRVQALLDVLEETNVSRFVLPEDVFWAACDGEGFRVAPIKVALQFSFETNVQKCYQLNDRKLPFGCHAWEKRDFAFWRPYIEAEGHHVNLNIPGDRDITLPMPDFRYLDLRKEDIRICGDSFFRWNHKKVIIWGAGQLGEECGWLLKKAGIEKYAYIDMNELRRGTVLWNQPIIWSENLELNSFNPFICIIAMKKERSQILNRMEQEGYSYGRELFFFEDWREELKKIANLKDNGYFWHD